MSFLERSTVHCPYLGGSTIGGFTVLCFLVFCAQSVAAAVVVRSEFDEAYFKQVCGLAII